jgi:DNA-binding NarL/FixJ family response regulator
MEAVEEHVKFLIVDDHPIFRHGLIALLERDPRYRVSAEAGSIEEALAAVEAQVPDMILLDISLGQQSGLDLLKALRVSHPEIKTLVISIHDEAVYAERALRAHARGYLMKQEASSVLKEAIATILAGKIFVSTAIEDKLLAQSCRARAEALRSETSILSDRELEVLKAMGQGFGAIETAGMMGIAVKTVNVYQDHIKKKLSLESIGELRKYAIQWVQSL